MSHYTRYGKTSPGPHMGYTEAQTLDQALTIIAAQQQVVKRTETAGSKKPSLRMQISRAKLGSNTKPISLSNGLIVAGKTARPKQAVLPHPLKSLSDEQKKERALLMFQSGTWGVGAKAGRTLAKAFGVSNETMSEWLGIEIWNADDFRAG